MTKANPSLELGNSPGLSTSPISQLPLELLQTVFDIARYTSIFTPVTLSHVCRKWRSLTLASPRLWTIVPMDLINSKYLQLWFDRSQPLGLTFKMGKGPGPIVVPVMTLEQALAGLINYFLAFEASLLPRLTELRIVGLGQFDLLVCVILAHFKGHWQGALQRLEHLCLHLTAEPDQEYPAVNVIDAALPNLRTLDIQTHVCLLSPTWIAKCTHLRELRLTYVSVPNIPVTLSELYTIILRVSPHLEVLHVHFPSNLPESPSVHRYRAMPGNVLELPRLRELQLSSSAPGLDALFAPLVRRMRAPRVVRLEKVDVSVLEEMGEGNPFPMLESLELIGAGGIGDTSDDVTRLFADSFSRFSQLRSVWFKSVAWPNGEYAKVLETSCPLLLHLSLETCEGVQEQDLRRLVEAREASDTLAALITLCLTRVEPIVLGEEGKVWFLGRVTRLDYEGAHLGVWSGCR